MLLTNYMHLLCDIKNFKYFRYKSFIYYNHARIISANVVCND
jgi:hypothetical protein